MTIADIKENSENEIVTTDTKDIKIPFIDACVQHGREIMDVQLGRIKDKGYDFAPQFQEMTIHLYLLGVIWKFAESLDFPEKARENAYSAIRLMLASDGMQEKKVRQRIEFLKKMARVEDGSNAHAVDAGYQSEPGDNSLAELFNHYVDEYQVSGEFWRLYERGRKTMLYGGLLVFFIVIWFVTLFMPGNSAISVLTAGLVSAALFVIPTFIIGLLIFKSKIKKVKQATSP
ncbi:MAG: hypothetical protein Q8K59_08030 [Nitrosomonas sp.]|nr:hypothetical protein [Nitrosomonas sp.]MDP1951025.1 hypothetical protein [Nitrosomonas sp.]